MHVKDNNLKVGEGGGLVLQRERAPGTEGIWLFVFIDMLVFLLIFFVFMSERMAHYELYKASQAHLSVAFGFVNTLVLLTSSWMVVESIRAAKLRRPAAVSLRLWLAVALGLLFAISKCTEYYIKVHAGIRLTTNPFFTFYFFITAVHFLHVLAGMIFLISFARSGRACMESEKYVISLENVGLFWHYVDVLWIFIFPMLYLL